MYILDSQERIDPRNTNRFRLSHGKLRGFRINGRAWTFSGTVCVDPPWDASEDLVEIARDKFMEAEGDRERPDGIEYLSVHCDISQLVLGSPTDAQQVLCVTVRGFLQAANSSWNSLWHSLLPYIRGPQMVIDWSRCSLSG